MAIQKTINISLDLKRVTSQPVSIPTLVAGDNGNKFVITLTDNGSSVDLTGTKVVCVFSKVSDGTTVEQDTEDAIVDLDDYGITPTGTPSVSNTITVVLSGGTATATTTISGGTVTVDSTVFAAKVGNDGTYVFTYETAGWRYGTHSVTISGNVITIDPVKASSYGNGKNNCEVQVYSGTYKDTLVTSAQFNFDGRPAIMNDTTIQAQEKYPVLIELINDVKGIKLANDYDKLSNRPQINSVTLTGNKTPSEIGVQAALVSGTNIKTINNTSILGSGNFELGEVSTYYQSTEPSDAVNGDIWVDTSTSSFGVGSGGGSGGTTNHAELSNLAYASSGHTGFQAAISSPSDIGAAAASHTHTESEITNLVSDLAGKVSEPSSEGTSGQVLATDGSGTRYWKTVSGGSGTSDHAELSNLAYATSGHTGFQATISDLATIRDGAALGATALQSYTETDPTVPSWAKASTKPSYSYSEISNTPTLATVATSGAYSDLSGTPTIPTVPTTLSSFTDDLGSSPTHTHSQYLTSHQDISGKLDSSHIAHETWTFTLSDSTTVTKAVCLWQ